MTFADDVDAPDLDTGVWLPHYLPMWSSREATWASYHLEQSCLVPDIPDEQGLWLPEDQPTPLRLPARRAATGPGRWGAPTGSTDDDLGALDGGVLAVRFRGRARAVWGDLRDRGLRQGRRTGRVGGDRRRLKQIRGPHLAQDFAAPRLAIDVAHLHTYAVDWAADEAVFTVDGEEVRRCATPPTYPLQLMPGVFDLPDWSTGEDDHLVPELWVDRIDGQRL